MLGALVAHTVPGLEAHDAERGAQTRLIATPGGTWLATVTLGQDSVELTTDAASPADIAAVSAAVRAWFDLDTDPAAITAALGGDAVIGPLVARRPGLRIVGHVNPFEAAVLAILGQQVSVAAARTFGARFVAAYGLPGKAGLKVFPGPGDIAAIPHDELRSTVGLTNARVRTVLGLAAACADGLELGAGMDYAELLALPGIGPWTVGYLALRAFADRDVFPAGDIVLQRALGVGSAAEAAAMAEAWRPYRAYAAFHLWTEVSYT